MIGKSGAFIGQVCHIEAANEGGPRFNKNQTNEERRAFSNLMLMCYSHHVETDDEQEYPTEKLRGIKAEHERLFGDIPEKLSQSFEDKTTKTGLRLPKTMKRMDRLLRWKHTETELQIDRAEVIEFSHRLAKLPRRARQAYNIICQRATAEEYNRRRLSIHELSMSTEENEQEIKKILQVLDNHGFIRDGFEDDFGLPSLLLNQIGSGWHFSDELIKFCKLEGIETNRIIVDLNFELLDESPADSSA